MWQTRSCGTMAKVKWSASARYFEGRRKAAMRFYKKNPLMAVDLMRALRDIHTGELRFPDYSQYQFECDIRKKLHVINRKPKTGKRTSPPTFKQEQLERMKDEISYQVLTKGEADHKLIRRYNMLLHNSSEFVQVPVAYKDKIMPINIPHNATKESAQALVAYINGLCREPHHTHEELRALITAYKENKFSTFAGG